MKKKLLTLVLALTMVLSMGTTAMAAENPTFKKSYGTDEANVPVGETLNFIVTAVGDNASSAPTVTVGTGNTHTVETYNDNISISVATPSVAGVYEYIITETAGGTQGEAYNTGANNTVGIQVLVNSSLVVEKVVIADVENSKKNDTVHNTYNVGSLKVKKVISGNMSSANDKFTVKVTFKTEPGKTVIGDITYNDGTEKKITSSAFSDGSAEVTLTLKATEEVTFSGIPYGIQYTVEEIDNGGYDKTVYSGTDITESNITLKDNTTVNGSETKADDIILDEETQNVTILNHKSTSVETGIIVNNLPYILVLAGVAVAAVVLFRRKRYSAM